MDEMHHAGRRVRAHDRAAEQLLTMSHLHNAEVYDRAIDTQVGRLRKKIAAHGAPAELIRTERGAGYIFTAEVQTVR